ncbi:VOC family protein [Micromonospora sp. NPDC049645]|uniref:VOC family protein n=1 Tax=Micromonospora sp. NPDC049645 TaxID=3155508 RepID=UPI0034409298
MEQRISLVTLGVADVARAKAFYEHLGWQGQEVEETVFIQAGGLAVVLWGRGKLAADAGIDDPGADGFGGMTLAQNVRSRAEVDEVIATAVKAGATVTKPAEETFYGGYAGYFADPDGHLWEIAWNPGFTLAEDGTLTVPDFSATN